MVCAVTVYVVLVGAFVDSVWSTLEPAKTRCALVDAGEPDFDVQVEEWPVDGPKDRFSVRVAWAPP